MSKQKGIKKLLFFVVFFVVAVLFLSLCWKKRIGIYNTFMKLTGQESNYEVLVNLKKDHYGYYKQELKVTMDREDNAKIQENDSASDDIETAISKESTLVETTAEIDQQLQSEQEQGYTWEEPMVISNPYQISPLTAVVLFDTDEECAVRVTVKGKTEAADISGELEKTTSHKVPVIGLYPGMDNRVVLELLDDSGKVTDSQEITITTDTLPETMQDVVTPVETSGESAYGLTMVYGQDTKYPLAYDCMGDVRWYMSREADNYGLYNLSNTHFLVQDTGGYVPSLGKPQTTNLYEFDYLGRAWNLYYVAGGTHHEVIEKEPGGNLLVLTSSLYYYEEDRIQEIDRNTGEVVNQLDMDELLKCKYTDQGDWAHVNTVSYQPEEDTIIISPRNLDSVIKVDWTTHEIKWILCDPRFWEGTEYEKYVLKQDGDFTYHIQQHSAYQLSADLDGNSDTVEISIFDNHYGYVRRKQIDYYERTGNSYVIVYSVDEKAGTVRQIKNLPVAFSKITSNTIYDEESNHIFGMSGHVKGHGMNYEFDYDTGEILNQYRIETSFYRATEMKIDYDLLAADFEPETNYIKGELWQPVETNKSVSSPSQSLPDGEVAFRITGKTLYVGTYDHRISQIIFKGQEHTYVYDVSDIDLNNKNILAFTEEIPVPLQNMESDEYQIYMMYQDEFCDTQQSFKIK